MNKLFGSAAIVVCLALCACSGPEAPAPVSTAALPPSPTAQVQEKIPTISDVEKAENPQQAAELMIQILEASGRDYRCRVMDGYEGHQGKWIYAVNAEGEWLDILLTDATIQQAEEWISLKGVIGRLRKNIDRSVCNATGQPLELSSSVSSLNISKNGAFTITISGHYFAMMDVNSWSGQVFWNMKPTTLSSRPRHTQSPELLHDNSDPKYRIYTPAPTLQEEVEAMKARLTAADPSYQIQTVSETLTLSGQSHDVVWFYAKNGDGLWVDAVFAEDAAILYSLFEQREEVFGTLRQEDVDAQNEKHPMRRLYPDQCEQHQFWLEDCVRQGYGFLLDGDGLAIKDAGAVCTMTSWNEEMERFANFLDRDVVLGIDYQYDIEKYFQ